MTARDDLRAALERHDSARYSLDVIGALQDAASAARALLAEEPRDTAAVEAVLALRSPGPETPDGPWIGYACALDDVREAITSARAGQGPAPAEAAVKRVEALCVEYEAESAEVPIVAVRAALAGEASS